MFVALCTGRNRGQQGDQEGNAGYGVVAVRLGLDSRDYLIGRAAGARDLTTIRAAGAPARREEP
jgi:hypothetical protein